MEAKHVAKVVLTPVKEQVKWQINHYTMLKKLSH